MRNAETVIVTTKSRAIFIQAGGKVAECQTAEPGRWSRLAQALANPLPDSACRDLTADFMDFSGAFLDQLISEGFILESSDVETLRSARDRMFHDNKAFSFGKWPLECEHLIVGCTGSVVSGLVAPTILSLRHSGFAQVLDVVLTDSARRFITADFLEAYGIRTWTDAFERRLGIHVPHVHLARSASCVVVLPASASSLHRLATGACTDMLSMLVAATTAPVVVAPAMNEVMWNHHAVQNNVNTLRNAGAYVLEPTVVFGAADFSTSGDAMYGGHGTFWLGPQALMHTIAAIRRAEEQDKQSERTVEAPLDWRGADRVSERDLFQNPTSRSS